MATKRTQRTVDLPQLQMRAAFTPETLNAEKRTVQITWTTGVRVLRGYYDKYYEELSLNPSHVRMERLNGGAPLLDTHQSDGIGSVIGVVESAKVSRKSGTAVVRFDTGEAGTEAMRKVSEGIVRNVSVGYQIHKMEKVEESADGIPVYRAIDWEPYELSLVPIGADAAAGTRSQSSEMNPCVFVTPQEGKTMQTRDNDDDETETPSASASKPKESAAAAATRAAVDAKAKSNKQRLEELNAEREAAIAEERVRSAEIRKIGDQSGLGDDWARTQIELGTTVEEARKLAFEKMVKDDQPIDGNLRIGAGDDARDKFIRGASAWILEHTGKRSLLEQAAKKSPGLVDIDFGAGNQFRGMSPFELARESLERNGVKTRGMNRMELLGRAFTHRSAYQTTGDFPLILENALHKILLGAYATQETTWQAFCGTEDVADFRPANRYRTGSLPSLPVVAEHGEYTNGVIPDAAKFQISTERHGEIFSLSREVIINDDMGALANLAGEFGRAAARTIENDVYALLALNTGLGPTMSDSQPFFDATRANVGTGSVITVAGLDADRVLMRAQKDPSNRDYLSLAPAILLVPDSLYGTALVINDAQYDPDTSNKLQKPNMVRGLFRNIVGTPRLTGTRRYLFSDPAQCAALVVAFLQGYGRGPIMESRDGWRVDGVEWKVTQYAKAQVFDPKGAVTNAGTT